MGKRLAAMWRHPAHGKVTDPIFDPVILMGEQTFYK
jgi:hypothetical protein